MSQHSPVYLRKKLAKTLSGIGILLGLQGISSVSIASEVEATFCKNCTSFSAAKAEAMQYSPPLECSAYFGPQMECTSRREEVNLVNPQTDQVYSFIVYHDDVAPWPIKADSNTLSNDKIYALEEASRASREFNQILDRINIGGEFSSIVLLESLGYSKDPYLGYNTNTDSGICPTDTALYAISRPDFMAKAEITAITKIMENSSSFGSSLPRISGGSVGLLAKGVNATIDFENKGEQSPYLFVTYQNSEVNTGIPDRLNFAVSIVAWNQGVPQITLKLSESSRVAGVSLSAARQGYAVIESVCAREYFEEWGNWSPLVGLAANQPADSDDNSSVGSGSGSVIGPGTQYTSCVLWEVRTGGGSYYYTICD